MQQSYKPHNMPDIVPYLVVCDTKKSIDFYQKAFGFQLANSTSDENGNITHVEMRYNDFMVMFCAEDSMGITAKSPATTGVEEAISLYLYVPNVDEVYELAMSNGASSISKPEDCFWGDRMCAVLDIDKYRWCFATHISK